MCENHVRPYDCSCTYDNGPKYFAAGAQVHIVPHDGLTLPPSRATQCDLLRYDDIPTDLGSLMDDHAIPTVAENASRPDIGLTRHASATENVECQFKQSWQDRYASEPESTAEVVHPDGVATHGLPRRRLATCMPISI